MKATSLIIDIGVRHTRRESSARHSSWMILPHLLSKIVAIGLLIGLLSACGAISAGSPPHWIITRNVGVGLLSDVVIDYGKPLVFKDETPVRPGSQMTNGGENPIPPTMIVMWRSADGVAHQVNVPLRSKIPSFDRLRAIELWFSDDKLQIYHSTARGDRGEFTDRRLIYP